MSVRRNRRAYQIIATEIAKAAAKDRYAGEVSRKIALKRLKRLNSTRCFY